MARNIDKELALHSIFKKWSNVSHIDSYSYMQTRKGRVLIINFLGYEIDCFHPDELLDFLSLLHNEIKEVIDSEIEIKYLKSYPLLDSID